MTTVSRPSARAPRQTAFDTAQAVQEAVERYGRYVARLPRTLSALERRELMLRASVGLYNEIDRLVSEARDIIAGDGARAGEYERFGSITWRDRLQTALRDLNRELEAMLSDKRIVKDAVRERAVTALGYRVRRVAFSEINNAYVERQLSRYAADPSVLAVRWVTTGPNPCPICVTLSRSNLWGMGAGVYPKTKVPVPPHPYCRCRRLPVYQLSASAKRTRRARVTYLRIPSGLTAGEQERTYEQLRIALAAAA